MRIDAVPDTLAILGGGVIAAEMAHIFGALGSQVTIVARSDVLLRSGDREVARRFTEVVSSRWDLRLARTVAKAETSPDGIRLHLCDQLGQPDPRPVDAELLLVATGRTPNSDTLAVTQTGVATHADGRVVVDDFQATAVDGIFALGVISSRYQLKHVANHEAHVVQHNLLHPYDPTKADHRFVPYAIFSGPQVAAVGKTEQELQASNTPYVVSREAYGNIAYGRAMEDTTGFAKLLADPSTGQLLGGHIIGPQASTVIQPIIQAMSFGLSAREMARGQYWIHPAMPEVVENALLNLQFD